MAGAGRARHCKEECHDLLPEASGYHVRSDFSIVLLSGIRRRTRRTGRSNGAGDHEHGVVFAASAVGPLVTPWERQAKTYERLVTSPASLSAILAGDILAGMLFGALLSVLPLAIGLSATDARIVSAPLLLVGVGLGAFAFSALGVLLSAPATDTPSQVMMLSNLVRLPIIFVSGVFIPLGQMPGWGRWLAPLSPLSYSADLVRVGFGEAGYFALWADGAALIGFTVAFLWLAHWLHRRTRDRAL